MPWWQIYEAVERELTLLCEALYVVQVDPNQTDVTSNFNAGVKTPELYHQCFRLVRGACTETVPSHI
jgi:hypothetical protein